MLSQHMNTDEGKGPRGAPHFHRAAVAAAGKGEDDKNEHGTLQADPQVGGEYATADYPLSEQEIRHELDAMGIDVMEPESRKEKTMAQALDAFSSFVLEEEKEKCQEIIGRHIGGSVGELQGGSEQQEIYRVMITDDEDDAAAELVKEFHTSWQGRRHANVLTIEKLKQYMLGMCDRRSSSRRCNKYTKLGNLMFILAFGPTNGQVRHIDHMDPNLQICLYMSCDCPSTIVYSMEGPQITNSNELVEYWGRHCIVPDLVRDILLGKGDTSLAGKRHTRYFAFWDTINATLKCFGKLYTPVSLQLSLQTDPGTTLMVGGNEVHAGPPTNGPRMFAFAIGVPEEDNQRDGSEDNDGEVQYNPALLHVDLCCILFTVMEFEYSEREDEHREAKQFLLNLLHEFVKEYPQETYSRLLGDDRGQVRDWLGKLVETLDDQEKVSVLVHEALESETMLYSPDVRNLKKRRAKKEKSRRNAK